jgi:hypothetical protein
MKFDLLIFGMEKQTPLPSSHPTYYVNILHYILFIKYFVLNITKT